MPRTREVDQFSKEDTINRCYSQDDPSVRIIRQRL